MSKLLANLSKRDPERGHQEREQQGPSSESPWLAAGPIRRQPWSTSPQAEGGLTPLAQPLRLDR